MHITPCQLGPIGPLPPLNGRPRVHADCACGSYFGAWDEAALRNKFAEHLTIPRPPADILAKDAPTLADVQAWPRFFLRGPGLAAARNARCAHDYLLTSSCPGCDADQERAEEAAHHGH